MFEKVHYVSVNKCNGHQLLNYMFILYLKDVVTLLNPEEVSRGECSRESGESAVECDTQTLPMDIKTIEEGDEMPSSTTHKIHRSKYTQTTGFKPTTRSVKTQTLIDATSRSSRRGFPILTKRGDKYRT